MAVDVEYARRGDISIAYQAIGSGPVDVIFGAGLCSHLDLMWGDPYATEFLKRLSALGRLLLFDKPGTGLSDPVIGPPTVEQRADDFLAVLDAAGSKRAIVIGFSEAGAPAMLLAATYPDRCEALVSLSGFPRGTVGPGHLAEIETRYEQWWDDLLWPATRNWGNGEFVLGLSPHMRDHALYRRLAPSVERASASPGMARAMLTAIRDYDVTGVVDAINVPTLVLHRREEVVPVECSRWTAEHISGARYIELPGDEHMCYFEPDDVVDAITTFVGGAPTRSTSSTRRLATVLFTDIAGSTAEVARLGDDRWRAVLAHHDQVVVEEVERYEGTLVKTMGDGVFAVFDRPLLGVRCALSLCRRMEDLGVSIRAGLHTGECEVVADDFAGIAVHIGSRIANLAQPGEVLVSSTVKDIVYGSGVAFESKGEHELKGVPGHWAVHAVVQDNSQDQRPGPDDSALKPFDRAVVGVAARMPAVSRAGVRMLGRVRSRKG